MTMTARSIGPAAIGLHAFRASGITAYLENGGTLEHAQQIAAHESPRATKLYDRTPDCHRRRSALNRPTIGLPLLDNAATRCDIQPPMRSSPVAAGTRVLVLVVQLLSGNLPGSSVVLCVAADGHTAVEVAHADGRCLTDYQRHHSEITDACDLDQHTCVDVVLSQQPLCSRAARETTAFSQGPSLPSMRVVFFPPLAAPLQRNTISPRASRLSAHRTIVLLV